MLYVCIHRKVNLDYILEKFVTIVGESHWKIVYSNNFRRTENYCFSFYSVKRLKSIHNLYRISIEGFTTLIWNTAQNSLNTEKKTIFNRNVFLLFSRWSKKKLHIGIPNYLIQTHKNGPAQQTKIYTTVLRRRTHIKLYNTSASIQYIYVHIHVRAHAHLGTENCMTQL